MDAGGSGGRRVCARPISRWPRHPSQMPLLWSCIEFTDGDSLVSEIRGRRPPALWRLFPGEGAMAAPRPDSGHLDDGGPHFDVGAWPTRLHSRDARSCRSSTADRRRKSIDTRPDRPGCHLADLGPGKARPAAPTGRNCQDPGELRQLKGPF